MSVLDIMTLKMRPTCCPETSANLLTEGVTSRKKRHSLCYAYFKQTLHTDPFQAYDLERNEIRSEVYKAEGHI